MNEYFNEIVLHLAFFRSKLTKDNLLPMTISKQQTALFFRLSISITVFGALFNFISWPLIILGAVGMVVFHGIQFFQKQQRSSLDYTRHLLIVTFLANYLFTIFDLPFGYVVTSLTKITLIAFLALYVKEILGSLKETDINNLMPNLNTEKLSLILADLATVYIVIASLFKILNLEFGIINSNLLLVIGLFTALISILAGSKNLAK